MASRSGHSYSNIYNSDASRSHLGDVYNQYGPSPDQQAFRAVLDSLRYDGMDDRRDRLNSAERGTFEWALAERAVEVGMAPEDDGEDEDEDEDEDVESSERCVESDEHSSRGDDDGGDDEDEDEDTDDEYDEDYSGDGYEGDYLDEYDFWRSTKTIDGAFTDWLMSDGEEGNLFCFMGKPGSGKSTLMYASSSWEGWPVCLSLTW
jgi:hypothetical protein